jgi:hypothetical protein
MFCGGHQKNPMRLKNPQPIRIATYCAKGCKSTEPTRNSDQVPGCLPKNGWAASRLPYHLRNWLLCENSDSVAMKNQIAFLMKVLSSLFCLLVVSITVRASDSVSFSNLGEAVALKYAENEMVLRMEEDALVAEAPNFWKCGWQIQRPTLPSLNTDSKKPLVILAKGESANAELVLKLRFVSGDWSRADIYEIPLNGLNAGDFTEFEATTNLGQPSEQENGGLSEGEAVGALQFLFRGKGNAPLNLAFSELRFP